MSEKTLISWCDSTVNFWSGCTKVSDGCKNCYAEALSNRNQGPIGKWGKGAPRRLHESAFKLALRLNRKPLVCSSCGSAFASDWAAKEGGTHCDTVLHRRRIFSLSLGDWLDPEVPVEWLARMLDTVRQCEQVTWMLCTKRPELWGKRLREVLDWTWTKQCPRQYAVNGRFQFWLSGWHCRNEVPKNIILLASVENQAMADQRIPELLKIPAACRGLSLEPLLGPVDVSHWCIEGGGGGLDWLIVGGESGNRARPCNVENIRSLVAQGKASGVATYVKQVGSLATVTEGSAAMSIPNLTYQTPHWKLILKDKKGGDPSEWPADLCVQEWPKGF